MKTQIISLCNCEPTRKLHASSRLIGAQQSVQSIKYCQSRRHDGLRAPLEKERYYQGRVQSRSSECAFQLTIPLLSADQLFNGDFEWGNQAVGYYEYNAPDHTSIPGWLIVGGGVARIENGYVPAYSGRWSVSLGNNGNSQGKIQQVTSIRDLSFAELFLQFLLLWRLQ
jgi:hypothetical protein